MKDQTVNKINVEKLVDRLRQKGIRVTHQRLEILKKIMSDPTHPAAEDIYARVVKQMPMISLDTVYRTIATFEEAGLIGRVEVLDDRARYDANIDPHHHLVCTNCKKIEDFYWPEFDNLKTPNEINNWGDIQSRNIEVRGLCRECAGKNSTTGKK